MTLLNNVTGYLIVLLCITCNLTFAQDDFASIHKNMNVLAKGLHHDLNKSKDTLMLRSSDKIFRVYTVSDNAGIVDNYLNTNKFEVLLRELKKGKYVFVVNQSKLKIVFQVHILKGKDAIPETWLSEKAETSESEKDDDLYDEALIEPQG